MSSSEHSEATVTIIPDELYKRIQKRLRRKQPIYEHFEGDTYPTKIWVDGETGKNMSHMPPQTIHKELQTISYMQESMKNARQIETGNGRGELLKRLLERGMERETALKMAIAIYQVLPVSTYLSDEAIDQLLMHP
jgi:hypothetical protein